MWGLSPCMDLLKVCEKFLNQPLDGELNILLMGSTDARHILKTVANVKRHPGGSDVRLNFYVLDLAMEFVARQMLLLTIALEPEDQLGLREKARIWMEVYGNTLLRPSTARYLMNKANQLIRMVTDRDYLKKRMPLLELDCLRYKDIDQLENIFKYWIHNRYSLAKIWDTNVRRSLRTRYDAKLGAFDWDYNMKLLDVPDGKRVCLSEYKQWRNTGVAFTWLETEFSVGNATLAVGIGVYGDQLYSRGYIGDMETGPYFSFGTDCEEPHMLETRSDHNLRRATDITERHLQRIFTEIETGSPPDDLYTSDINMGLVISGAGNADFDEETKIDFEPEKCAEDYTAIPVHHKVIFLPANALQTYTKKEKFMNFFDIMYVSENYFQFLSNDIIRMGKRNCPLIIETRKFVIAYDKKIAEFGKVVKKTMKDFGGKEITKCFFTKDSYALFKINMADINEENSSGSSDDETSAEKNKANEVVVKNNHTDFLSVETNVNDDEEDASREAEALEEIKDKVEGVNVTSTDLDGSEDLRRPEQHASTTEEDIVKTKPKEPSFDTEGLAEVKPDNDIVKTKSKEPSFDTEGPAKVKPENDIVKTKPREPSFDTEGPAEVKPENDIVKTKPREPSFDTEGPAEVKPENDIVKTKPKESSFDTEGPAKVKPENVIHSEDQQKDFMFDCEGHD